MTPTATRCLRCGVTWIDLDAFHGHACVSRTVTARDLHPSTIAAPRPPRVEPRAPEPNPSGFGGDLADQGGQPA